MSTSYKVGMFSSNLRCLEAGTTGYNMKDCSHNKNNSWQSYRHLTKAFFFVYAGCRTKRTTRANGKYTTFVFISLRFLKMWFIIQTLLKEDIYRHMMMWFFLWIGVVTILGIFLRQKSLILQGPPGEQGPRGEAGAKGDKVSDNTQNPTNICTCTYLLSTSLKTYNNGSSNSSCDNYYYWAGGVLYSQRPQSYHCLRLGNISILYHYHDMSLHIILDSTT